MFEQAFRNIDDVGGMLKQASSARNAVVIGGGLLGLEAASGLAKQGMVINQKPFHAAFRLRRGSINGSGLLGDLVFPRQRRGASVGSVAVFARATTEKM